MAYYLVDFENVKNVRGVETLSENDTVVFFYSKNSNSLTFSLHREILSSSAKFLYFEVENGTKNALDFQLSSYLGFLLAKYPAEKFYILSKDKDYSKVITFWTEKESFNFNVERIENIVSVQTPEEKIEVAPKENKKISTQILDELKRKNGELKLSSQDMEKVNQVVNQYKSRQAINNNLMKYFKNSEKVGKITKVIRPFLKSKS